MFANWFEWLTFFFVQIYQSYIFQMGLHSGSKLIHFSVWCCQWFWQHHWFKCSPKPLQSLHRALQMTVDSLLRTVLSPSYIVTIIRPKNFPFGFIADSYPSTGTISDDALVNSRWWTERPYPSPRFCQILFIIFFRPATFSFVLHFFRFLIFGEYTAHLTEICQGLT